MALGLAIALAASSSSGLPISYNITGPASISEFGSFLLMTGAGTITVTASQAGNGIYAPAISVVQNLNVSPAPLTLSALAAYCQAGSDHNPSFGARITGFVPPDTEQTVLTGQPVFSTAATCAHSADGSYPLDVAKGSLAFVNATIAANYTLTGFTGSTLNITSGTTRQTITFNPLATVTYGSVKSFPLNATSSSGLDIAYTYAGSSINRTGSTVNILGAGSATITAMQGGNNTYLAAVSVTQPLTINPAALTVTAPSLTLSVGTSINPANLVPPAGVFPTISGWQANDTQAYVAGNPLYATTAPSTPGAGLYPVTASLGTLNLFPLVAANYVYSKFIPGTLTVTGKSQTIAFNSLYGTTYGSPLQPRAIASSGLPVSFALSGLGIFAGTNTDTITLPAGTNAATVYTTGVGTLTITATQPGNSQYDAASPEMESVTITPAPLNITANPVTQELGVPIPGNPFTQQPGQTLPVFSYLVGSSAAGAPGGFVNNDTDIPSVITGVPSISTNAIPTSPPGVYPINVSLGTLSAPNYYFVLNPDPTFSTFTLLPPGSYSISATPSSLIIPAGQSRQTTITLTLRIFTREL